MKLSLSTAAARDLALPSLEALDDACRARGLDGIEVVLRANDDETTVATRVHGSRVVAVRAEQLDERSARTVARISGRIGAPVSIPPAVVRALSLTSDPNHLDRLTALARVFAEEGGRLLLGFFTELDEAVALADAVRAAEAPSLGLSWEVRPNEDDLRNAGPALLATRDQLGLVRLYGGGPEQRDQDARGVGPLFVDLALSAYGGPIVLTPSSAAELPRWREWLASQKIAGCGSAHSSRPSPSVGELDVDVRDVEPRDRLGTILGAYRALPRGSTLRITLDHDPSCMVYALEDSEPAGSFGFRKVGDGPEVWSAEVTKH